MSSGLMSATSPISAGLWYAVDHATDTVRAYVFGKRRDDVFKELKALLACPPLALAVISPMIGRL